MMETCCICKGPCDGSLLRTDPRYHRVRDMLLADEVPRTRFRAGIKLCHPCQRNVYFCGGFNRLLVKVLKNEARLATIKHGVDRRVGTIVRHNYPNPHLATIQSFGLRSSASKTMLRREAKKIARARPSPDTERR